MTIKNLASKLGISEDELVYAFSRIGWTKQNGEPKSNAIKIGLFNNKGEFSNKKEAMEELDNNMDKLLSFVKDLKIESLQNALEELTERFNTLETEHNEWLDDIENRLATVESSAIKPKKEKKKRKMDWSTKARGMIGKKYNGWSFVGDKLDVVASKKGKKDVRVSGMKSKDDFLAMLD